MSNYNHSNKYHVSKYCQIITILNYCTRFYKKIVFYIFNKVHLHCFFSATRSFSRGCNAILAKFWHKQVRQTTLTFVFVNHHRNPIPKLKTPSKFHYTPYTKKLPRKVTYLDISHVFLKVERCWKFSTCLHECKITPPASTWLSWHMLWSWIGYAYIRQDFQDCGRSKDALWIDRKNPSR